MTEPVRARRGGYLLAAALIAALSIGAVLFASQSDPAAVTGKVDTKRLSVGPAAPALDAKAWINSAPLTPSAVHGQVVLYDFWTYSCINCVRTFPYIRSWWDRYRRDGLVVVGVHSPEFDFEKVHGNVAAAVKRLDVTWPVALDDDMTIWNEFSNQYWPADYLTDRSGRIRYTHFGEGDYTNTENVIRQLLDIRTTAPRAARVGHAETGSGRQVNPETYLGLRYQQAPSQIKAGAHVYPIPAAGSVTAPSFALVGSWTGVDENVTSGRAAASILLGVHAREVNLVMATPGGAPIDAIVQLDGHPVPAADRGASVHVDANGRTVVTVKAPDMYRIVSSVAVGDHVLGITAASSGLAAYSFTFG